MPTASQPFQQLVLPFYFLVAIVEGGQWYFIVLLMCTSLMTNSTKVKKIQLTDETPTITSLPPKKNLKLYKFGGEGVFLYQGECHSSVISLKTEAIISASLAFSTQKIFV